ncbi:MAG TPA: ATP-binding protein [Pyrinomonadaceae bacterium]|nr:ATP-binding protein [Pyrinomonadaceae bacterium]
MNEEQRLFVADARDIVEKLDRDLELLYTARADGRRRRQLAAQIFRRVHTLKGSAGSFAFKSISRIAHEFEGVLDGVRLGRVQLTDDVLNNFADALDAITDALAESPTADLTPESDRVMRRLHALAAESRKLGAIASKLRQALPPDIAQSLSEYDLQHAREAVREGAKLFVVSASFAIDNFDQAFRDLTRLLGESGETISTVPGAPLTTDEISFRLLYAAEVISAELVRQANSIGNVSHDELNVTPEGGAAGLTSANLIVAAPLKTSIPDVPVRVELKQVDELISAATDLFRHTTKSVAAVAGHQSPTTEHVTRDLRPRFLEFEERLMKLRLVPVREVLERTAARAGRIAARQLGKDVEFEIIGGDVGIEKSLVEVIADPLLHLVRNAITHGIESPDGRRAAGKNSTGRVTLAASNHSGRIHITVTDDGRGIDIDRVLAAAREQGIASESLSVDQCLRLIFRPGFSTSELSDMSGRGIGLDVVDRAMEVAGGEVRVASETGRGTTFAMIVPAGLSMVRCLLVRDSEQVYAIDGTYATELGDHAATENDADEPLLQLNELVGNENAMHNAPKIIRWGAPARPMTKENRARTYRIAVEDIIARQETLVRSLGRHAPRWPGVCGAAELFDGNVALVLDLQELISSSINAE